MLLSRLASSNSITMPPIYRSGASLLRSLLVCLITLAPSLHATATKQADDAFIATWATSIRPLRIDHLTPQFDDTVLIQTVRISAGGERARLHLSNLYGESELVIASAALALLPEGDTKATEPKAQHTPLTFGGQSAFIIPAGQDAVSDPIAFPVSALSDVAITLHIKKAPPTHSGHNAGAVSRSLHRPLQSPTPNQYERVNRWFFIHALDVSTTATPRGTIVLLGDSITDGGGGPFSKRWGDELARRLHGPEKSNGIGVVNKGFTGSPLLRKNYFGAPALERLERDVLQINGARWLIIHIGINDLGTIGDAYKKGEAAPAISELIAGYEALIDRAHAAGLKVYGSTLLPFKGAGIWTKIGEEYRKAINEWTRNQAPYNAIIDFDAALRDPTDPDYLAGKYGGGDFLHPSAAGQHAMAHAIDLGLFEVDE